MNERLRPIARSHPSETFVQYAIDLDRPETPIFREEGGFGAGEGHLSLQRAIRFGYELERLGAGWLVSLAHREKQRATPFTPAEILSAWTTRLSKNAAKQHSKKSPHPLDAEFVASLAAQWIALNQTSKGGAEAIKFELEADGQLTGVEIDHDRDRKRRILEKAILTHLPFGTCSSASVITADGIRVPDIAWSADRNYRWMSAPYPRFRAPDIWIDIVADKPLLSRIRRRHVGLFLAGAIECWVCGPSGKMTFYSPEGSMWQSQICPMFPLTISRET